MTDRNQSLGALMIDAAERYGVTVLVGVRSKGTWFAHADGVEFDGGSPQDAVRSVVVGLQRRTEKELHEASRAVEAARQKLGDGATHESER